MSLNRELAKLKRRNLEKMPKDVADVILKDVEIQTKRDITKSALRTGNRMPAFALQNAVGRMVHSDELLENGPLIISFYRGAWCPYCNMELAAYQSALPDIIAAGAQLIAISPELPDASIPLIERHALKYEILSDTNNEVARQFGLVYRLDDPLMRAYEKLGIDLEARQGNSNSELPIAATYVVGTDGSILEAAVNYDYTCRLDPHEAIEIVKTCAY